MLRQALVVGINNYPWLQNLKTPASDAEQVASLLEKYGGFQIVKRLPVKDNEGLLTVDENPSPQQLVTSEILKKALAELFNPQGRDIPDTALLYFAGHGLRSDEGVIEGFLATINANPRRDVWGVSLNWLQRLLQSSPVKEQIILLDCCYSGELLNGKFVNFDEADPGERGQARSRCFITACGDASVAYGNAEHGILTSLLLKGLDPQRCEIGQWINNHDLAAFITQQLQNDEKLRTYPQHPLCNNLGGDIKLIQGAKLSSHSTVNLLQNDKYQSQIVLHWLIQLLTNDTIESIKVDSQAIPGKNSSVTANDIVIFYKDGHSSSIETQELEDWEHQNQLDLERVVPKANLAMLVLEKYIQNNNTHFRDTKYKITRSDILAELAKHELNPTPKRSEAEILANFNSASNIGRYWLRKIDGKKIPRSELPKIIELIEQGSRTILLIDRPGSGKTCVLLDLADFIERDKASVWGLLFIKGDQFTSVSSEQESTAHGLPEDIVGQCARLADYRQVVVIIDSLDVLSLSRQHGALKVFLGIIDRLEKLERVTVIVACRNFDLEYDPLLRGRSWEHKINLQPLDFDNEVKPFLIDWKVDVSNITPELRSLLQIPQNLRIYERVAKLGVPLQPSSAYELYNSFLEEVVVKNSTLGTEAVVALQNMAEQLIQQRTQSCNLDLLSGWVLQ
jgi:Caspase domain/ATPase family associated with various cellular activities (AAA)